MKMESQIRLINIENIIPNRFQPRLQFDENGLSELAASIVEHGIIQPLVLRRLGDKYEIIAGERRYKAAQLAGLTSVPAIISDLDDNESAEVAIIENTQRRNLSAIEEAKSYKKLLDRKYVTQDQLAKRLGVSQSAVANKIRLLSLPDAVQDALINEKISERHARSLLKLTDKPKQVELLNKIIDERWTVKRLDDEIDSIISGYKQKLEPGAIHTSGRYDLDVNNIINNATDITPIGENINQTYSNLNDNIPENKKNSLFFNNLENESVNMDPTRDVGFNPFQNVQLNIPNMNNDYELLDLEENEEQEVKTEIKEEPLNTMDDVISAIKNILDKAKNNGVGIETEEFNFDELYQFIIKINKED